MPINEQPYEKKTAKAGQPKSDRFAGRSRARMVAFQILYQEDLNAGSASEFGNDYIAEELSSEREDVRIFCQSLVVGTRSHAAEIDAKLGKTAAHWTLERMAATDRNILRLAVYEMMHLGTPRPVVINEAVELAKRFGSADSAAFVNGVLDKVVVP